MAHKSLLILRVVAAAAIQLFCVHASGNPQAMHDSTPLIPCGTSLSFALVTGLDSDRVKSEDTFSGRLSEDVIVDAKICIPKGSIVSGHISKARKEFPASLTLVFDRLTQPNGLSVPITATLNRAGCIRVDRSGQKVVFTCPASSYLDLPLRSSTTIIGPKKTSLRLLPQDVLILDLCEDLVLR